MEKWLTIQQASIKLATSERTIERQITDKKIRSKKIKGKRFVAIETDKTDKEEPTTPPKDVASPLPNWQPPAGYLLVDKDTMDILKQQLKDNTNTVKIMLERQREQNLLLNNLQSQVRQLMPGNSEATTPPNGTDNVAQSVGKVSVVKNKNKTDKRPTDDTTSVPDNKNAVEPTTEAQIEPVKENKQEIKPFWSKWFQK